MLMRPLFSDGFNSFAHVSFGVLGAKITPLMLIFLIYELIFDVPDANIYVDISELSYLR